MKNIFESVLKLDPVTQLELKDYLVDNIVEILKLKDSNSKIIKSYKEENLICENAITNYTVMEKLKMEYKNIYVLIVKKQLL